MIYIELSIKFLIAIWFKTLIFQKERGKQLIKYLIMVINKKRKIWMINITISYR